MAKPKTNTSSKTNTKFMNDLMDFSNHGALMQLFVLSAVEKYAKLVKDLDPEEFEGGIIYGPAWIGCAKEALTKIDEHLKG